LDEDDVEEDAADLFSPTAAAATAFSSLKEPSLSFSPST
jgi:hypothetical protein